MPTYIFRRESTGEVWEEFISFARREEILQDPDVSQVPFAPAIVSGVIGTSLRVDDGFKEVLSKVAEAHPNSPLADRHLKRGVKEVKTREIVKKHSKKKK